MKAEKMTAVKLFRENSLRRIQRRTLVQGGETGAYGVTGCIKNQNISQFVLKMQCIVFAIIGLQTPKENSPSSSICIYIYIYTHTAHT